MAPIHRIHDSPVGPLTLVAHDGALTGLYFEEHRHPASAERLGERGDDEVVTETARQLDEYFAGSRESFDLPLAPVGTPFQQRVWLALRRIPFGETRSYAALADDLGDRLAIRAVAAANGRNPISIVVPCHRVIGSDGSLTGYAGGVDRKRALLELEHPMVSLF